MSLRSVSAFILAGGVVMASWVPALAPAAARRGEEPGPSRVLLVQGPPEIRLEGRESVQMMRRFGPFLGQWTRAESPPGTRLDAQGGGIFWRLVLKGIAVESSAGPWDDAETPPLQIFWHPIEREYVFRKYEARNPVDLLFEGRYEFLDDTTLKRIYTGFYGDGRMERYRETYTIMADGRMSARTDMLRRGEWEQLFDGSIYERREGSEQAAEREGAASAPAAFSGRRGDR